MSRCPCPLSVPPHALALAGALLFAALPTSAAVFKPTPGRDVPVGACDTDCSLREAVVAANANPGVDVILLAPEYYDLSIVGAGEEGGDLDVTGELLLIGAGARRTVIRSRVSDRQIDLHGARLEIIGVTLDGGSAINENGGVVRNGGGELIISRSEIVNGGAFGENTFGGAIYSDGTLSIVESTVSYAGAGNGGGIAARGILTLINSTISGNHAQTGLGGGLYLFADVAGRVSNTTIMHNRAEQRAGGVFIESAASLGGSPDFRNTVIAGNTAPLDSDCSGSADSLGFNLLGVGGGCFDFTAAHDDLVGTAATPLNPQLTPLGHNGGPTPTHAPLAASPVVDAGNACEATDQRGADRPGPPSTRCDIGAVELTTGCLPGFTNLCLENGRLSVTVGWQTPQGQSGPAQAVQLTDDAGYFWFFRPENIEVTAKVVNACVPAFNRFWVFLAGMTNVKVDITVTDTKTGQVKTYANPQGRPFRTILDTQAFATCP